MPEASSAIWTAGASNLPRDEGNAVLPSQAGEHQLIRLPGQTRVSPEEYKEFLGLGHGDVFDLDPDRWLMNLLSSFLSMQMASANANALKM